MKTQNSPFKKDVRFFAGGHYYKVCLCIIGFLLWAQAALCGDLEIVRAEYGAAGNWKDVTETVRSKVKDSALAVPVGNQLFGDPAEGQFKTLVLTVRYNGREFRLSAEENAILVVNEDSLVNGVHAEVNAVQKAIDDAYARGERRMKLPPAVYRISPPQGQGAHLRLREMKDFEVDATGSTLILEKLESAGVVFENCSNVSFKGGIIRRADFPFSQGDIVAIAADRSYLDIRIHDGYPDDMDSPYFKASPILTIFERTGKLKRNILDLDLRIKSIETRAERQFRFHLLKPFDAGMPLEVGDMAAWRKLTREQVFMLNCEKMSFSGVTIKNAAAVAVAERGGEGRNYYSYTVTYDDPPKGSAQKPLLSGAADGFNSADVRNGATLENCLLEGMHDDGISIHADISLVLEAEKDGVIINSRMFPGSLKEGDTIQFYDTRCIPSDRAKVLAVEKLSNYNPPAGKLGNAPVRSFTDPARARYFRLKLEHHVPAKFGWYLVNLNACGAGYVIRNCTTREHRARGFLLYSENGIIENNLVERCSYGGIVVAPSFRGCGEGPYGSNLIIRNNIIREVGFATEFWNVGLTVSAWEHGGFVPLPGGHRNILIEGNRFENNDGPNIMISSAVGVTVRNNTFLNPMRDAYHGLRPPLPPDSLIALTECRDVTFADNLIFAPGPFMKKIVGLTDTASASGTESGFRIDPAK